MVWVNREGDFRQVYKYFSLRIKLIAMLLFVGLTAAFAVGGAAYWMLMQDFNASVRERAFGNFQSDIQAYIGEYGSWENAQRNLLFPDFVMRRRAGGEGMARKAFSNGEIPFRRPPFHFLLTDPQGKVLLAPAGYQKGQKVGDADFRHARPISVGDRVVALAVPVGVPQLSEQDHAYLSVMRKALLNGMLGATVLAVVLGLLLGSRFGARVRELTVAIRSMRADGELRQQVPVRSRDEMGELAEAFNRMSRELAHAHAELKMTTAQVQSQSEQLKELSIRDPLTHLFNRRYFDEHAMELYSRAVDGGKPLCVVVGDLDYFKEVNDNLSHAIGDEVLRRIAGLLRHNIRRSDVAARYGGEEFVIAFVESTEEQAAARCEELRRSIEQYSWHEVHPQLRVTMSMGLCGDTEQGSIEKMLAAADSALYDAKRGGRNRVVGSRSAS